MFQDLTDRAMGGQSLKFAFGGFCAAGFLPNQFTRTIGPPAEECLEGPGRILACQGNSERGLMGFYDDEQWLHDYALENRKEMAAMNSSGEPQSDAAYVEGSCDDADADTEEVCELDPEASLHGSMLSGPRSPRSPRGGGWRACYVYRQVHPP